MIEVGRLCVKVAGRDARMKCVVVDILDGNYALIDGQTRRKKCNMGHLEPTQQVLKIEKNASHEGVVSALKEIGIIVSEKKAKPKQEKPKKKRAGKEKTEKAKITN
ncbi:MAG: 50S ribosomal protein L14e [Candidatus Woesearchaeota archaeon]